MSKHKEFEEYQPFSLQDEMASIILLRYKECGIFDFNYDKEPLPVELDIAEEIINKVLDAAIEAIDRSPLPMSNTVMPHRQRHINDGINIAIKAIQALKVDASEE